MTDLLSPAHIAALGLPPLHEPAKARRTARKARAWAVALMAVAGIVAAVTVVLLTVIGA